MTPPPAEEKVKFLANIQRLLAEGSFVTTYKHALLLALADLSVEIGNDTGAALPVCFYCGGRLDAVAAVDHFIPWSRNPVDFGHNFVLSHGTCNSKKGDRLAAFEHLMRWCQRNHVNGKALDEAFIAANIFADRTVSVLITRWAYEQIEASAGMVWVSGEKLVPLDAKWRSVVRVAS